ncbi:MAG TPA: TM2 domain-containing protein [Gemmatimonadales bacterium]|jgi:TM2 domain-containing membrane protein YozV|nr:TM2 domain-containing protein [Gemmatimonadales bacterium]
MTLPDAYLPPETHQPDVSDRSRGVAAVLGFFGGVFGLHRFYVGKNKTGIAMLVTLGGMGIWWLYDMVLLVTGEFRDADDLPLRNWYVEEPRQLRSRSDPRVDVMEQELDALRDQFNDLAERVDFAERMLAQHRDRPQLPRG